MDDFIKTKNWVAIALLATLFIMNPVASKYGEICCHLFGLSVKLIYSYYATVAFLGAAVYFYSLQFFTSKRFRLQQTIGNVCYAISFSVSFTYISMFILSYFVKATETREGMRSLEISFSVLIGAFVTVLAFVIARAIINRDKIAIGEQYEKEEHAFIQRAHLLFHDKYYDLSAIEIFKALETAFRKALLRCNVSAERLSTIDLIDKARKMELITSEESRDLHRLRLMRNDFAHGEGNISKNEASDFMDNAKSFISILSALEITEKGQRAFNWLMRNYNTALEVLQTKSHSDLSDVMDCIDEAWRYRDKAISKEMTVFIEKGFINNTSSMIDWFSSNPGKLGPWIKEISHNIYTDYTGVKTDEIEHIRKSILDNLSEYIDKSSDGKKRKAAKRIKDKMKRTTVHKP
jgi:hypothetical protein